MHCKVLYQDDVTHDVTIPGINVTFPEPTGNKKSVESKLKMHNIKQVLNKVEHMKNY